jgi:hypothetical protein
LAIDLASQFAEHFGNVAVNLIHAALATDEFADLLSEHFGGVIECLLSSEPDEFGNAVSFFLGEAHSLALCSGARVLNSSAIRQMASGTVSALASWITLPEWCAISLTVQPPPTLRSSQNRQVSHALAS